ncbi:DUF2169 domain-containing protein [Burkholderia sp. WSM2232]|uniref:DUF2169 domain-containing protein n=1 Tax=Burkholderia sp. WSM2232 TaxID=944436 RepID=UPI000426DF55|nr:DUF2169 domain-containing protein [Burkholderia sp. WSM2232]
MKIDKPSDTLLLFNAGALPGRPTACVTLGYLAGVDGHLESEQNAWRTLAALFGGTAFDEGMKKVRGTFAVVGNAFAPRGCQVTGLEVVARVGKLEKRLHVYGDRSWELGQLGWRQTPPRSFESMPVGLQQAYGGKQWPSNPVGRGYYANADDAKGMSLPNVEHLHSPLQTPNDRPSPATFWPLPAGAPERTRLIGKPDERWKRNDFPRLPADTDPRYFDGVDEAQCAPDYWRGDERYEVTGMHADKSKVQGVLPGLRPRLLWRSKAEPQRVGEAKLDLDTVWLLPNTEQVLVLYRALIELSQIDAVEIDALYICTERLTEPAQTQSVLAARWRDAGAQQPVAGAGLSTKADVANGSAAVGAPGATSLAAFSDEIWSRISATHADMASQLEEAKATGGIKEALKSLGEDLQLPAFERPAPGPARVMPIQEVSEESISAKIADAQAEAEQHLREALRSSGIDADKLLAQKPAADDDPTPTQLLAKADLSDEVRAQAQEAITAAETLKAQVLAQIAAGMSAAFPKASAALPGSAAVALLGPRRSLDGAAFRAAHERGESLVRVRVENAKLEGIDLSGADLSDSEFIRCDWRGARLPGVRLDKALLVDCMLDGVEAANLSGRAMTIRGASLRGARLPGADLSDARCERSFFHDVDLSGAKLERLDARESVFVCAKLAGVAGAGARFTACDLSAGQGAGADWRGMVVQDCAARQLSLTGANLSRSSWWNVAAAAVDFRDANWSSARIGKGSDFASGQFNGVDFTDASVQQASFASSTLRGARLERALFADCNLCGTDAYRAVAVQSDLAGCDLSGARWIGANLMRASLRRTLLVNADLSGANLYAVDVRGARIESLALEQSLLARTTIGEQA